LLLRNLLLQLLQRFGVAKSAAAAVGEIWCYEICC
jgi:hypothetical protein